VRIPGRPLLAPTTQRRTRSELGVGALLLILGLALSTAVPDYRAQEWALWVIYGMLALSFTFVWGHAGIFSFGQAAFFGIGGYAYGITGIDLSGRTNETLTALVAAACVAALVAAALGYFIFYGNVGAVYVAIITLAVTLVLLTVMSSTADPKYHVGAAALGGYNGLAGLQRAARQLRDPGRGGCRALEHPATSAFRAHRGRRPRERAAHFAAGL